MGSLLLLKGFKPPYFYIVEQPNVFTHTILVLQHVHNSTVVMIPSTLRSVFACFNILIQGKLRIKKDVESEREREREREIERERRRELRDVNKGLTETKKRQRKGVEEN